MELTKEDKLNINKLLFHKEYNQIYHLYGSEVYQEYVPKLIKLKDIHLLKKAKNYDLLYQKHNWYSVYDNYFFSILYETGNLKKAKKYTHKEMNKELINFILTLNVIALLVFRIYGFTEKLDNSIKYKKEIEDYNKMLNEYGIELETKSDLDVIMSILEEEKSIEYATPKINALGYQRLDALNKKGVCRNIADDFVAKINKINPLYNARTILVHMKTDEEENILNKICNHKMVLMDIPDTDIILGVDPTNRRIGILLDGKLYDITSECDDTWDLKMILSFYDILISNTQYSLGDLDSVFFKYFKSFETEESLEEIKEDYGKSEQVKSLNRIKK